MTSEPPSYQALGKWNAAVGKVYRILIQYDGCLVPVLWFRLAKDGSLYSGQHIKGTPEYVRIGEFKAGEHVSYDSGIDVDISSANNFSKTSVHASGEIHMLHLTYDGASIRKERRRHVLCHYLFQQPNIKYAVTDAKKTDAVLPFSVAPDRPLIGVVSLSPQADLIVDDFPAEKRSFNFLFSYPETDLGALVLQISLYDEPHPAVWPPANYTIMKAEPRRPDEEPQSPS